jgi:hypothetical protein
MENSTQTEEMSIVELSKSINLKLDEIHSVLGYILEKTNLIPIKIPHKGVDNGFKTITVPPVQNKIVEEVINAETEELPQDA